MKFGVTVNISVPRYKFWGLLVIYVPGEPNSSCFPRVPQRRRPGIRFGGSKDASNCRRRRRWHPQLSTDVLIVLRRQIYGRLSRRRRYIEPYTSDVYCVFVTAAFGSDETFCHRRCNFREY